MCTLSKFPEPFYLPPLQSVDNITCPIYVQGCHEAQSKWEGIIFIDCLPCTVHARYGHLHYLRRNRESLRGYHLHKDDSKRQNKDFQISLVPKAVLYLFLSLFLFFLTIFLQYSFDKFFKSTKHYLFCEIVSDSLGHIYMFLSLSSYFLI